jgi:hypothetical protein
MSFYQSQAAGTALTTLPPERSHHATTPDEEQLHA